MRRRRTRIVLFCLLALVWCQLSAAAQLCGPHGSVDTAVEASTALPPCHEGDPEADRCMAGDCSAAQALKDPSAAGFAFAVAPSSEHFRLVMALGPSVCIATLDTLPLPTGPPPHFLGRLLI